MCGLTGVFTMEPGVRAELAGSVASMSATLTHRGPDDAGVWTDADAGIGFGFRRLAIVDLSREGHQPMHSSSGRYVVAFNGEIYNHRELRRELERSGHLFRGTSDTEVLLAAIEAWGLARSVARFVGMFAIALWDRESRTLHLVRDRLGIKPLYVFSRPGTVIFGSELKALAAGPAFDATIDPQALTAYLRYLYVPGPRTIFRHIRKLEPGRILALVDPRLELPPAVPYWSMAEVAEEGGRSGGPVSEAEAIEEGEAVVADAVRLRMRADVPVGAFLSGGIDSSLVVAMMQRVASRPVRTFTIGFAERGHDESAHARAVAAHLGTDHTEVLLCGQDAQRLIPDLPDIFDEPLADPSQLPTFLVCREARREVTVALSGDGGDELFAGYNRYVSGARVVNRALAIPRPVRKLIAGRVEGLTTGAWDQVFARIAPAVPSRLRYRMPGEKLHKIAALLRRQGAGSMYRSLLSAWQDPAELVPGLEEPPAAVERILAGGTPLGLAERMMLADQVTYLPDDLLAKLDRASMAVGLEARVPLLDHRVAAFAWRLPHSMRIRGNTGKWILRQILHRHVPPALVEREKMGFSVPIAEWLRGPLRPWAEDLLTPEALRRSRMLRPEPIRAAWSRLKEGDARAGLAIWAVLVFQGWAMRWTR